MDEFEIGFIESFDELLDYLEQAFSTMVDFAQNKCLDELKLLGVTPSKVKNNPEPPNI